MLVLKVRKRTFRQKKNRNAATQASVGSRVESEFEMPPVALV